MSEYTYSPIMNYATRQRESIDLPYVGGASLEYVAGWVKYYIGDILKDYAPLRSPTFVGAPKAPTPSAGDNSTRIATTAFVNSAIQDALRGAGLATVYTYKGSVNSYADLPASGNTVGDVYNIITADATHDILPGDNVAWDGSQWDKLAGLVDLEGYAPINSPAFTGVPTADTAAKGTNTIQLATTAFVQTALGDYTKTSDLGDLALLDNIPHTKISDWDQATSNFLTEHQSLNGVVKTTGNQSIAGTKTFSSSPQVPTASAGDSSQKAASTAFVQNAVNAAGDSYVKTTGNQTVDGVKTFNSSPKAPTPATGDNSTKVATTAFVQDAISNANITASVPVTKVTATWPANATSLTITDNSITATNLVVIVAPTTETAFDAVALAKITSTSQSAGRIVLTALGTAPSSATPIAIAIIGD